MPPPKPAEHLALLSTRDMLDLGWYLKGVKTVTGPGDLTPNTIYVLDSDVQAEFQKTVARKGERFVSKRMLRRVVLCTAEDELVPPKWWSHICPKLSPEK